MSGERGYSLVEMVVVMAILGVVISGLTTIFVSGSHAELDMNRRFQAQQQARLAIDKIRGDIHCAQDVQAGLTVNTFPAVKMYAPNCSSMNNSATTITWCIETSSAMTGRYTLWRTTSSTSSACQSADTARAAVADYLTRNTSIFTISTIPQDTLELVQVDFPISANPTATRDVYELKDLIAARNSVRCTTSGGCAASAYSVP